MKVTNVNATPRSRVFKYYNSAAGQLIASGGNSTYVPPNIPDREDQIIVQDTFQDLPLPPDTYVILGITLDDNNVYIWDTGDNVWTNATVDTGVSQIIQGNNITITPQTGKGDVTVNGTAPALTRDTDTTNNLDLLTDATQMNGNTIATRYKTLTQGTNMSITQNSNQIVLNSTGGGGISLNSSGTGNSVSSLSLSGSTLTQNMGYKLNSVTETSDTSFGFFYVSANQQPSYVSGVLNLPYKALLQGTGISITSDNAYTVISQTGGGNVQDTNISGILKMYRYEYILPDPITIQGYGYYVPFLVSPEMVGMSAIWNQFPTISWYGETSAISLSTFYDQNKYRIYLNIQNCNSQPVTIAANCEFDILFFGQ